jgi:MFS family permease
VTGVLTTRLEPASVGNRRHLGRSFGKVWTSVALSGTGDGMFLTAFPLLAATLTRDPLLIAGVTIASRLPWLLFSLVTGAIADRMDRRRLMVAADVFRFAVVALLGAAVLSGDARIWSLYGCAFCLGVAETLHTNAAQAILPAIVEPGDLMQANARLTGVQVAAGQFAGPPIGSALFNASAAVPFLADAVSFAGSALLISRLPDAHRVERPTTRLRDDIREGVRFMRGHPALRRLAALLGLVNFFYFAAEPLLILYTAERLHSGKIVYTALFIAAATGTIVNRWVVGSVSRRLGARRTMTIAFWAWAVTMTGLAITTSPVVAVVLFLVLGIGNGMWTVVNVTLRQQLTPNRLLGRMNAAYRMVAWGVVPFGAAFGGLVARQFGLQATFVVAAVVHVLVAVFAARLLRPTTVRPDAPGAPAGV